MDSIFGPVRDPLRLEFQNQLKISKRTKSFLYFAIGNVK